MLLAMNVPSHSPMAPAPTGRSAGPPSSSKVRGATDWQTGHGADSLAVFYMVVTETEVTDSYNNDACAKTITLMAITDATMSSCQRSPPPHYVNVDTCRM